MLKDSTLDTLRAAFTPVVDHLADNSDRYPASFHAVLIPVATQVTLGYFLGEWDVRALNADLDTWLRYMTENPRVASDVSPEFNIDLMVLAATLIDVQKELLSLA